MFRCCKNLKSLDLSKFDTKNVTDMLNIYYDCEKLNDLKIFSSTEKVKEMTGMLDGCSNLYRLDLSKFDT